MALCSEDQSERVRAQIAARAWKELALLYRRIARAHESALPEQLKWRRIHVARRSAADVKIALHEMGEQDVPGSDGFEAAWTC